MTSILQKALKAIATIRTLGDEDEWITETTGVRFGVRYTDETHADGLVDEGWTDRGPARARRDELKASGAANVYLVKITTRWRRKPRAAALARVEPTPPIAEPAAGT